MGDNKRWFKVWNCILSDPGFDELPNDCAGVWVRLGALISKHGSNGNITVTKFQFFKRTNTQEIDLQNVINNLKKINVFVTPDDNGNITVTFNNWRKYQEITDSYARVKAFREREMKRPDVTLSCNAPKEEKRREKEEKRKEDIQVDFISQIKLNPAYKEIDIDRELSKMDAWLLTPKGKGKKKTKRFIVNWLNRIDVPIVLETISSKKSLPYNDIRRYQ